VFTHTDKNTGNQALDHDSDVKTIRNNEVAGNQGSGANAQNDGKTTFTGTNSIPGNATVQTPGGVQGCE
jgi:hypothetical protein